MIELELAGLGFGFERRRAEGGEKYISSSISNPSCRIGWLTVDLMSSGRDWGVDEIRRFVLESAMVDTEVEVEAEVDDRGVTKSIRDPIGT